MRTTIYACDYCEAVLSTPLISKPHLSIKIGTPSGRVEVESQVWRYAYHLPGGTYQFCDTRCLRDWFGKVLGQRSG